MVKKINSSKVSKVLMVNVDTIELELEGMNFENPSPQEVTLVDRGTGEIRDRYGNRVYMEGKNGAHRMSVRTKNSGRKLCISGSPFAYMYGQNIFTDSDVLRGCQIAIKKAIKKYNINPPPELLARWLSGDFILTRVDLAVNFRLDSEAEVLEILKQIRRQLIEQVGPTRTSGTSVYWDPKNGKEYLIGFYAKGPQLRRAKRYKKLKGRDKLIAEAETILRVEVRLRASELHKHGLIKASAWESDSASKVFRAYMGSLKILNVTSGVVTDKELEILPNNFRHVLTVHKAGVDLTRIYAPRSVQRYRSHFRKLGIDLRCPNQDVGSITQLPKCLSPKKVINEPPQWMIDAKLVPSEKPLVEKKLTVPNEQPSLEKEISVPTIKLEQQNVNLVVDANNFKETTPLKKKPKVFTDFNFDFKLKPKPKGTRRIL